MEGALLAGLGSSRALHPSLMPQVCVGCHLAAFAIRGNACMPHEHMHHTT